MTWEQIRVRHLDVNWWKGLWFSYNTPKYAFHMWIAIYDRLSTGDRMLKWNIGVDGICSLCQSTTETRNHLYFECKFTEEIWRNLTKKLLANKYTTNWDSLLALLVDDSQDKITQFLMRYVFQATLHTIWRERNNRRHGETPLAAKHLITFIDKQVRNRLATIRSIGDKRLEDGMTAWFASR